MFPELTTADPIPAPRWTVRLSRPRLGRRAKLVLGIGIPLVAAAAYGLSRSGGPAADAKPALPALTVAAVKVERAPMADTLLVNGSLTPWEDLTIGAEVSGLAITRVLVDEGDWVKSGQLLAKLDDSLLQAQLHQTEAQIARSQATLKMNVDDVRRAHELLKTSAISLQAAEQREAAADTARADLALAQAQRAALLAQLAQTEIRAPTNGLVSARTARLGTVVSSSDPLFREVRDGILELDAEIPDRLLGRVRPGQVVRIKRGDGGVIEGKVRLVAPLVDKVSRNGIAHVRFPLDAALRSGMFVSGELVLDQADVLEVPETAVLVKDGRPVVFGIDGDGKAVLRQIETGPRLDGKVAVRSGVALGDRVITSGAGFLHDGDRVTVANTPS